MEPAEGLRFCRACLVPEEEETEQFMSVFNDNGKLAYNIYTLTGIIMLEVDGKIPSLICKRCVDDLKSVEKLKMRILDADDCFSTMNVNAEKHFLKEDMKALISGRSEGQRPNKRSRRSSPIRRESLHIEPDYMNVKIKQEPEEIMKPKERVKAKPVSEPTPKESPVTKATSVPKSARSKLAPKATPNKLGIHRMIIKSKTKSTDIEAMFTPPPARPKKKSSRPRLFGTRSKPKVKRSSTGGINHISSECVSCKETFDSTSALNEHLLVHDATLASNESLGDHARSRHKGSQNVTI